MNVVLIKGWWHKGKLRTCKGEGIEVWLSRELREAQPVGVEAVMNAVASWPSRDLRGRIDMLMALDPPRFDLFSSFQQMSGFRMCGNFWVAGQMEVSINRWGAWVRESSLCLQILGHGPAVLNPACVDLVPLRAQWERCLRERRVYNGNAGYWIRSIKALWIDGELRSMGTRTRRLDRKWLVFWHVLIRSLATVTLCRHGFG